MKISIKKRVYQVCATIATVTILSSCMSLMTVVKTEFKFNSLSHLRYDDSRILLPGKTGDIAFMLSESFRNAGGTVLERELVNIFPNKTAESDSCWDAKRELTQMEFAAFNAKDYGAYVDIDRETPFKTRQLSLDCKVFAEEKRERPDTYKLLIDFPNKQISNQIYKPTVSNFFISNGQKMTQGMVVSGGSSNVRLDIFTRLRIYVWPSDSADEVNVFMIATPVIGDIEAQEGATVGSLWWPTTDGKTEANVVKSYLLLLEDHMRKQNYR